MNEPHRQNTEPRKVTPKRAYCDSICMRLENGRDSSVLVEVRAVVMGPGRGGTWEQEGGSALGLRAGPC